MHWAARVTRIMLYGVVDTKLGHHATGLGGHMSICDGRSYLPRRIYWTHAVRHIKTHEYFERSTSHAALHGVIFSGPLLPCKHATSLLDRRSSAFLAVPTIPALVDVRRGSNVSMGALALEGPRRMTAFETARHGMYPAGLCSGKAYYNQPAVHRKDSRQKAAYQHRHVAFWNSRPMIPQHAAVRSGVDRQRMSRRRCHHLRLCARR